jgi:N-acyl-D-glutamate deacylase
MMAAKNEQYDVVLANGRVIDPETYLDGTFNVGIKGDRIAAISDQPLKGKEVIDVSGMIVSPGFIDTHAHGMNIPSNRIQAFDGLTTALELEAGILPVGEFYDNCAKEGRPINYGVSSGWGYGRLVTMNPEVAIDGKPQPRLPFLFEKFALKEWTMNVSTDKEFKQILAWTEQGIKEGGIGIGVIHGYAPGVGPKELLAVWQLAKQYNVPTYTHIQHVSMVDPESSVQSMIQLMGMAAATGAHTHVCHWNSTSMRDIPTIRDIVQRAQAAGLKVTTEAYVYGAANSAIGAAEFDPKDVEQRLAVHFSDFTLVRTNRDFIDKKTFEKARAEHPGDAVVAHFLREDDDPHDASLLDMSVLYPGTAICTDSITWTDEKGNWYEGTDWPVPDGLQSHPRAAGNYARFLRKWVRERRVLSWMDAIRQASLNACLILEDYAPALKKKGRLQEGMDADIIVIDPETVTDTATFKEPCQLSKGMKHVLVNGTFLIRDEELDTKAMPGRPVRGPVIA